MSHQLRIGLASLALSVPCADPSIAVAQDGARVSDDRLRYFVGLTTASDYVTNGISQTGGRPTIQPLFEIDWRGLYAGTVLSLVRNGPNRAEYDVYVGYRRRMKNGVFIDTGYRRFLFNNSHDCCGEFKLRLIAPLFGDLGGEIYLGYNPQLASFNRRGHLVWSVSDRLTASAAYGETSANSNEYWNAGMTYALTDKLSLDLRYQGAESGDAGVVVKLSWASVENSLARIFVNPLGQ
ncbi:MAG: TorF family putative porin [Jhaorihella sp.]